jgi:hypothetical protein
MTWAQSEEGLDAAGRDQQKLGAMQWGADGLRKDLVAAVKGGGEVEELVQSLLRSAGRGVGGGDHVGLDNRVEQSMAASSSVSRSEAYANAIQGELLSPDATFTNGPIFRRICFDSVHQCTLQLLPNRLDISNAHGSGLAAFASAYGSVLNR